MSDCLNIFLQTHGIPFDGTYLSGYGTITREQFEKSFSKRVIGEFNALNFNEQNIIIDKLKQLRDNFSDDFQQKLRSKYGMNASFFDRDKYTEELYKITQIGFDPPIGNYGYLQLIQLNLRNLEPRQYVESGWFRSMMFDFYDCMLKLIIHSTALAQIESYHDKKTETTTLDKNYEDSSKSLTSEFERFMEKRGFRQYLGQKYNKNQDDYKQVNTNKNTDSKKGGNKKNKHKKTKNKKQTQKNKHKKTKRKY
jgi:hypothetical protein